MTLTRSFIHVFFLVCAVLSVLFISCSSSGGGDGQQTSCTPTATPEDARADGIIHVPGELCTVQAGLDAAWTGDTVLVDDGTYKENLVWPAIDGITLKSANGAGSTIIDGGGEGEVILFHTDPEYIITPATVVEGFTITNGYAHQVLHSGYDGGGGIHIFAAAPTIRNNVIVGNHTIYNGGGIGLLWAADAVLDNNNIRGNSADGDGGGFYARNESSVTFTGNTVQGNHADGCGGGYLLSPTSSLVADIGNSVSGNTDFDCQCNVPCDNTCDWSADCPLGTGGGSSSGDACDQCLAGCSGMSSCCTGSGCLCQAECSAGCTEWYCTLYGDCWCIAASNQIGVSLSVN